MEITWLGHSGFRIEIDGQVLLIDPWLTGNPMFPEARKQEAAAEYPWYTNLEGTAAWVG